MTALGRRELEARVGNVHDALGPRVLVEQEGAARGNRIAVLRSGTGLEATVSLDRGMDLRDVWWQGRPVSYHSSAGDAAPAMYDPTGSEWLRTFAGGLLTTCGLRNVGPPVEDAGERFGQHGRITASPATSTRAWGDWDGDRFVSRVAGMVREAAVAGEHLELHREISVVAGTDRITLRDIVRNTGFRPEPVLLMYHCNLGWPLVDEGTEIDIASSAATDMVTGEPVSAAGWRTAPAPTANPGANRVIIHDVKTDDDGWASVGVVNRLISAGPHALTVKWRGDQLPHLTQWTSFLPGTYVLGIEPGNCIPSGRPSELAAGRGDILEPGEEKHVDFVLEFG